MLYKTRLGIFIIPVILLSGCWNKSNETENVDAVAERSSVISVSDEKHFDEIIESNKPIVVKFHAVWCGVCTKMKELYSELSEEMKNEITFTQVDIDKNSDLAKKYSITGVPTILIFKDGNCINQKNPMVGFYDKDELKKQINETIE
jgi:thioredoxin 1